MSGGVDSSMAAALLVEQGYRVLGVMLRLWAEEGPAGNRCCAPDAMSGARQVADLLGIPFYVRDYREWFKQAVVDPFVTTYAQGQTPNPCITCNTRIRFGRLLDEARGLGASYLATGHYVRRCPTPGGEYQLLKGVDAAKDQSYVLYRLTQAQLAHALFPIGDYVKPDIRSMARTRGLPVSDRPDSQDLCFLGADDYREFMARHMPGNLRPGPMEDSAGHVLGQHPGLANYTVGQRKGLGIRASRPRYVLRLDVARNAVIVGGADELGRSELTAHQVSYVRGQVPDGPLPVMAKIRYKAPDAPAELTPLPDLRARLRFEQPLRDITPGQSVVFYTGDVLLGGGVIHA